MLGLAKPFVRLFQNPTGTIGAAARALLEFLYSGIALSPPTQPIPRVFTALASRSNTVTCFASSTTTATALASRSNTVSAFASEN